MVRLSEPMVHYGPHRWGVALAVSLIRDCVFFLSLTLAVTYFAQLAWAVNSKAGRSAESSVAALVAVCSQMQRLAAYSVCYCSDNFLRSRYIPLIPPRAQL